MPISPERLCRIGGISNMNLSRPQIHQDNFIYTVSSGVGIYIYSLGVCLKNPSPFNKQWLVRKMIRHHKPLEQTANNLLPKNPLVSTKFWRYTQIEMHNTNLKNSSFGHGMAKKCWVRRKTLGTRVKWTNKSTNLLFFVGWLSLP